MHRAYQIALAQAARAAAIRSGATLVIPGHVTDVIDILQHYRNAGTNRQRWQAFLDDADGAPRHRTGYLKDGIVKVDTTIAITGSKDEHLLIGAGPQFDGTRIEPDGDVTVLSGNAGTRFELMNVLFYLRYSGAPAEDWTSWLIDFTNMSFQRLENIHADGPRSLGYRQGIRLIDCDSAHLRRIRCESWGSDSIIIEQSGGQSSVIDCNFEGFPGEDANVLFQGGRSDWVNVQLERVQCYINNKGDIIGLRANSEVRVTLGPRAVNKTITIDGKASGQVVFTHPFVLIGPSNGQNCSLVTGAPMLSALRHSKSHPRRVIVEADTDYMIGVLLNHAHTEASGQPRLIARDVDGNQTGVLDSRASVTVPSLDATVTYGTAAYEGHVLHGTARSGDTQFEANGPGFVIVRGWKSLVSNGRFIDSAGALSSTGWVPYQCSLAEVAPWHVSQNYTGTGTVTLSAGATSGTFATAGTAMDKQAKVGDYLYSPNDGGEWRRLTAVGASTYTIASAFTSAVTAETLVFAQPWREIDAGANAQWSMSQDILGKARAGRPIMLQARVWGNIKLGYGDMRRGDAGQRISMAISGSSDRLPVKLADGSQILSCVFDHFFQAGATPASLVSLGNTEAQGVDHPRVQWIGAYDLSGIPDDELEDHETRIAALEAA